MTMLIYPRVIDVFLKLLVEKGIIKPFKYCETIGFVIVSMIVVYTYVFESMNLSPNFIKGVNSFAMLTNGEATIFATVGEQITRNINAYYWGKK
jgi:hypothetical protein